VSPLGTNQPVELACWARLCSCMSCILARCSLASQLCHQAACPQMHNPEDGYVRSVRIDYLMGLLILRHGGATGCTILFACRAAAANWWSFQQPRQTADSSYWCKSK
jgi:hypothetical protein